MYIKMSFFDIVFQLNMQDFSAGMGIFKKIK
jgi:hypothetical protein